MSAGAEIGRPDLGAAAGARLHKTLTALSALGGIVCVLAVLVTLTGNAPAGERAAPALAHALVVGIPIFAGLAAWYLRPRSRFGPLLVATAFAWSLTTLAESDNSFLYSTGRVSLWLVEPAVLYLMLAFPSGHLSGRVDRALVGSMVAMVALLFLPTALLIDSYPPVRPLSGCDTQCPPNFFMVVDTTPGFVGPMRAIREVLLVLVFVAVAVRLLDRITHATRLTRRTVTPVLAAAITRLVAYVAFLPARKIAPDSAAVDALGWLLLLSLPAIALGFLVGIVRWRLHVADAMERLARSAIAGRNRAGLRAAMRDALEDPTLEVAYRVSGNPGGWVGPDGLDAHGPDRSQTVTTVTDNGGPAVALVHDPALGEHRDFVVAAASVALFATENERLTARLRSSLRDLERSRTRIVAAADRERRRIERDLHDGAQQRLVALRIKLELAEELMGTDPGHARQLLAEAESELDEALEDMRSLARGIYPSVLADRGLGDALRAAARRAPVRTSFECKDVGRYPPEVEGAVYFSCLEALQNAAKHARGATAVRLSLAGDADELRFEVLDDGDGFDPGDGGDGQGLTNMRDRLAAVGGRLTVRSAPGRGTVVSGTVPAHSNAEIPA